ncbi:hypothetical protein [Brachybacterium sp. FME24]|uniref:hypothetical protein n=1 Tax=Brachybacterium sp. FME24 TaxID=2742605 RepID=UPI001865B86C|nr:hypothetical protein [Brachybacterium sp. FME24]
MNHTPRTEPPTAGGSTQAQATRPSRKPFYLSVGCASVILGLILGIGGFFGVRTITAPRESPSAVASIPVGEGAPVPLGTTFPFTSPEQFPGEAEVTVTEIDWDASTAVTEASDINEPPPEGEKYVLATADVTYRGDGTLRTLLWANMVYVAADGTEYPQDHVTAPSQGEVPAEVSEGNGFSDEFTFLVPTDVPQDGHFVLIPDFGLDVDKGAWVAAT